MFGTLFVEIFQEEKRLEISYMKDNRKELRKSKIQARNSLSQEERERLSAVEMVFTEAGIYYKKT